MTDVIETRSARRTRLAAFAPRVAVYGVLALLAAAGLRSVVRPGVTPPAPRVTEAAGDLGAEAFAQSFVRAYLTWSGDDSDAHQQSLSNFLPTAVTDGGPLVAPGPNAEQVRWTAAVKDVPRPSGDRLVEVEADTSRGDRYVEVPVASAAGFLYVAGYPSLVGPPATTTSATPPSEDDVSDPDLTAVVHRALSNYLDGQAVNLRADLTPDAVVSLPPAPLTVRSFDALTWAAPGLAAASVTAVDGDGTTWSLRYELSVVRRDRWYVAAVGVNPTS